MVIKSLKYDYQTAGILVEYATKKEARDMVNEILKSVFENGELKKFEGYVTAVYSVENYLMVGTDLEAGQLDQIIEFIESSADPDQEDDGVSYVDEDFSMGVSGPTGLNQGIPHGGPGKGCLPKPLYNPKAKAVPPEEKDDEDTEENLKKLRAAKKLLKSEGYVLERADVGPYTMNEFENYLHDDMGFDWDEVDCLIDNNREMIQDRLDRFTNYDRICADLDDSCLEALRD